MRNLIIKIKDSENINNEDFDYIDVSRIDGRRIFKYNKELPEFEVLQIMSIEEPSYSSDESKFSEWLLGEIETNNINNINFMDSSSGIDFGFWDFQIENMKVLFSFGGVIELESQKDLFSNKYNHNLKYKFQDNEKYIALYDKVYKIVSDLDEKDNEKRLNEFLKNK